MPKLSIISNYYEPLAFVTKFNLKKDEIINYLNRSYRLAVRNILCEHPASYAKSPLFSFCIDSILHNMDIDKVTLKWLDDQIKENPKLKNLDPSSPNAKKIELIKIVTKAHQDNLILLT